MMPSETEPTGPGNSTDAASVSSLYDWLSYQVQFANWRVFGQRYASFTMHKALETGSGDAMRGADFVNDLLLQHARLPDWPHVLDAGCGFGGTVFRLKEKFDGTYHGYTLSKVQLRVAKKEAARKGWINDCHFQLRNYDEPVLERFDAVVAVEALCHASDLEHTLSNLAVSLVPGGFFFIIEDMALDDIDEIAPKEAELLRKHWSCRRFPRPADYDRLLAASGLEIIERIDLTPRVRFREVKVLDALEQKYRNRYRRIPLRPVRSILSAYLGGIALERLYAQKLAAYRMLIARKC